MAIEKRSK